MDRFRKELRMMVMDLVSVLPYSKHCIPLYKYVKKGHRENNRVNFVELLET